MNVAITMRIDTGQQPDSVYTTESLLVVTSTDGHTSMIFSVVNLNHHAPLPTLLGNLPVVIIILTGIGLVSGYIAAVHVISCDL